MNPLIAALIELGGSGSVDEIYEKVLEIEGIDESVSSVPHNPEKSNQTEVGYRLAWARTYLKKFGYLESRSFLFHLFGDIPLQEVRQCIILL